MSDCPRFGKLFGGCKFSPRYDRVDESILDNAAFWAAARGQTVNQPVPGKTYVRDVCERCGKTVERAR